MLEVAAAGNPRKNKAKLQVARERTKQNHCTSKCLVRDLPGMPEIAACWSCRSGQASQEIFGGVGKGAGKMSLDS